MTTKHTPGPWSIGDDSNAGCEVIAGPVAILLDRIPRCPGGGSEYIISRDEMSANAHLIAAAPDLLAALHHISLASQNSMSSKEECGRIAREAIAKATKEKP